MALSVINTTFGVHSAALLDAVTGLPLTKGIVRVLASLEITYSVEKINLKGGSLRGNWATEEGETEASFKMTVREHPQSLFLANGAVFTETAPSASGTITALNNKKGASVASSVTGISAALIQTEANAKAGIYIARAITSSTVQLYSTTNMDFTKGVAVEYVDDTLAVLSAPVTISNGANTDIPSLGLRLTGGSAVNMTVGDTAIFMVTPKHNGLKAYSLGQPGTISPALTIHAFSKKRGGGGYTQIIMPNVALSDLPLSFTENEFSEIELSGAINIGRDLITGFEGLFSVIEVGNAI
jgi:hypothetical protein